MNDADTQAALARFERELRARLEDQDDQLRKIERGMTPADVVQLEAFVEAAARRAVREETRMHRAAPWSARPSANRCVVCPHPAKQSGRLNTQATVTLAQPPDQRQCEQHHPRLPDDLSGQEL